MKTANEIAQDIISFLSQNKELSLHPGRTPEAQGELVIKKGGCPCVPGRPKCPCDEALEDIKELNRCRCFLFVNAEYLKIYEVMVVKGGFKVGGANRRKKTQPSVESPVESPAPPHVSPRAAD